MAYNLITTDILNKLETLVETNSSKKFIEKCKELNVSYNTARSIFYKNGTRIVADKSILLEKNKEDIIFMYSSYKTITPIMGKYNINRKAIMKFLIANNVNVKHSSRTNFFREDFFTTYSNELAYFMGFALADGCIYNSKIEFSIHKQDECILQQFCDWLGYDYKSIKDRVNKNQKRLSIESKFLFGNNMPEWGLVPNKTYKASIPFFPTKWFKSFLIGLIDGDGHIRYKQYNNTGYLISIVNHHKIIKWVSETIKMLGFKGKIQIINYTGKCYSRLLISRKQNFKQFIEFINLKMYFNMALKRKWQRVFNELC